MDARQCTECGECYRPELQACPHCGSSDSRLLKGFRPTGPSPLAEQPRPVAAPAAPRGEIGCVLRTVAAAAGAAMVASLFMTWGQERPLAITYLRMGDLLAQKLQSLMQSAGPRVLAILGPVPSAAYVLVAALGGCRYRRRALFLVFGGALGVGCAWETQNLLLEGAFGNATKAIGSGFELFATAAFAALLVGLWGRFAEVETDASRKPALGDTRAPAPAEAPRPAPTGGEPAPADAPTPAPAGTRLVVGVEDVSADELLRRAQHYEAGTSPVDADKAVACYQAFCTQFADHPLVGWARERIEALQAKAQR